MHKITFFETLQVLMCGLLLFSSCELDNYGGPDAQLSGRIIDSETGEPIQSDIVEGTTIKIIEHGYDPVTPQYLRVKTDGTYANTMLFANTYTIQPDQRNFSQIDVQEIEIGKDTQLDFMVTPYIRVKDVSIKQEGNNIIAEFKLQQLTTDAVKKIGLYASGESIVGERVRSVAVERELNQQVDENETFRIGLNLVRNSAFFESGRKYFFRIGAVSSFPGALSNYAPASEIEIGKIDPNAEPSGKVLDAAETTDGWGSAGPLSLASDSREGTYSLKTSLNANAVPVFEKQFSSPFNTEVSMEHGVFSFWLYVSDVQMLNTNIPDWGSAIEITSSGGPDNQELSWNFSMLTLHNGWNKIDLKLSDAIIDNRGGDINLSAVNYFRMYHLFCGGAVDVMIDEIKFYEDY
ncbi:DUF3823 domain-containing protein [Parapedobacter soli]|uniref:DUF3823 domain-containing protein n=1 Tax=Parapedobacter soli TaxID=416955 RepID=UPI0021CA293C|nr:DUF3823 domain-containing protein [Parapedobacter soli]